MIEVAESGRRYDIRYKYCACDLVQRKYINTSDLCECSRSSLLYNWETIFGEGNVKVEMVQTILCGAQCCQFIVSILKNV